MTDTWGLGDVTAPVVVRAFDPPRMAVWVGVHEFPLPVAHPAHDQIMLIAINVYGPACIVCLPGLPGLLSGQKPRRPDVPLGHIPVAEILVTANSTAISECNIRQWTVEPVEDEVVA